MRNEAEQLQALDQESIAVLHFQNALNIFYERLNEMAKSRDAARFIAESDILREHVLQQAKRTEEAFSNLPPELRTDPTALTPLEAVQIALPSYLDSMNKLARSGDWTALHYRLEEQIRPLESLGSELVKNVDVHVGSARAQAALNFRRAERRIFLIYLLTAILTLVVAALMAFATTRSITDPLRDLIEGSKTLARGEFQHQIPVRGSDELAHLSGVFNQTASELQSLYKELQQLVDLVPQFIVVLQPHGKLIHANHFTLEYTGVTLDEYRSVDFLGKIIHPDDVETMRSVREHGLSQSAPFEVEARVRNKDGVYRWFLFRYNPFFENGTVRRWYGTATEIESRKQKEDRVRKENVRLEERTRIAQELHDTLLQTFLSATMQLRVVVGRISQNQNVNPLLERVLQIMDDGIQEGRSAIRDLRSSDAIASDLVQELSRVQREVAAKPDVDFRVVVAGRQQPLQPSVCHEIYRISREALLNAFGHSRASLVECKLEYTESDLRIRIHDNGCGIEPQVIQEGREGHWGLPGMRERAARIGGTLTITSTPRVGTEVFLLIPSVFAFQHSATDQERINRCT